MKLSKAQLFFVFCLSAASSLCAESWVSGAVMVSDLSDPISIYQLGTAKEELLSDEIPYTGNGLFRIEAGHGVTSLYRTSNRISMLFEGEGSFAVERIEQLLFSEEDWNNQSTEISKSRTIMNLREGVLAIDARSLSTLSQLTVESPLGRLNINRALFLVAVDYDHRNRNYEFSIDCLYGSLRFNDKQGESYLLRAGQRLSGAGDNLDPSIEVSEVTADSAETLEQFLEELSRSEAPADTFQRFASRFKPITSVASRETNRQQTQESRQRPIVIEHAPAAPPVTPFRGQIKSPTGFQSDL